LSLPEKNGSKANYVQLRRAAAHPFLTVRGELRLNAQFWIGALKLFRSELSKDSQYDDLRYEFDNAAKRSMKELFKFLIDLSEIPDSIREILERHEKLVTSRLAAPIPQDPALLT
jgi:hypothetical protein